MLLGDLCLLEKCFVGLESLRQESCSVGILRVLGGFRALQRCVVGVSVDNVLA